MSTYHEARRAEAGAAWLKSTYSSEAGGNCIEVAALASTRVAVRDSKVPTGPVLLVSPAAFAALTAFVKGTG